MISWHAWLAAVKLSWFRTLRPPHSPSRGVLPAVRSGGRVVEGARLESEYTPKAYRGFESLPLRHLVH